MHCSKKNQSYNFGFLFVLTLQPLSPFNTKKDKFGLFTIY
jgi:hypothetical protein